jgi:hypothetical protein
VRRRSPGVVVACLAVAALAVGCGDGDGGGAGQPDEAVQAQEQQAREGANQLCRARERRVARAARRLQLESGASGTLELTTEGLVKPGIELIEQDAEKLRRLDAPDGGEVDAYVDLFDPILALARERLRAGQAGEFGESRELEKLMIALAEEQRAAARQAGMRACDVDLLATLFAALGG